MTELDKTKLRPELDELLVRYAAGELSEDTALLVASHLTLQPESRKRVAVLESVGGAVLEDCQRELSDPEGAFRDMLSHLGRSEDGKREDGHPEIVDGELASVPAPLRERLAASGQRAQWKGRFPGVREIPLSRDGDRVVKLMKIRRGRAIPQHTHAGTELTLVLSGGFSDSSGSYGPGDIAIAGKHDDHKPVADRDEDCVCLTVTDGPLKLTGRFGRLLPYLNV